MDWASSHGQRVLAVVGVVAFAGAGGLEPVLLVQSLGDEVGDPHLQSHYRGPIFQAGSHGTDEQQFSDSLPPQFLPNVSGSLMKSGSFNQINYMTSGSVTIEQKDGKFFIVFGDNFSTPNGPDLVVYLTKNSSKTTRDDIVKGEVLGELKSIIGKQTYEIPSNINIEEYKSVSIQCRAFNVPWSFAPLE